jgi:hypothetical protein
MKNHNWNWRVILEKTCWRRTLLEAYLAGGYLCPKLLTSEPKVVKKIHLGAERSILRSGGSSSEAPPGAVESILGPKRLSLKLLKLILELCRLILEPWRINLEPWKLFLDHCNSSWRCRRLTWRHRASLWSRGELPWSRGGSSWSVEAHPGTMESHPESLWLILEP